MDVYKCDTCGAERSQEDKRVISVAKANGSPDRKPVETCIFCIAKGLVITENLVTLQKVE